MLYVVLAHTTNLRLDYPTQSVTHHPWKRALPTAEANVLFA